MINMSLARIMYGTNHGVHVPYSMSLSTFSVRDVQSARLDSEKSVAPGGFSRLNGLLHKAWTELTGN